MNRSRLNIYVEAEHVRRLRELAATQGLSKSAVIATALASFLSPEGQERREAAFARRLDRLAGQFERLERDQNILIETIALFIRYEFSIATSVPEAHQEAARAQGKARFEKFVEQLARHIQRGGSLVRDLHTEIYPDEKLFFSDEPDSTGSSGVPS